jgi:HEPN domain-containing protein
MYLNDLSSAAERYLNELRDVADQDYVLARVAFKYGLDDQFLWLSQQAVEKYVKTLLIFHGHSALGFGHGLKKPLAVLATISEVPFGFPKTVSDFAAYLDAYANRYAETLRPVSTDRLVELDTVTWFLRRFCGNLRGNAERRLHVTADAVRAEIARRADVKFLRRPDSFWLTGGYLDQVRRNRRSAERKYLVWNNLCFSRRRRTAVTSYRRGAKNSWLRIYPAIPAELKDRLHFTKRLS